MRRRGLRRRGAASNGQAWERVTVDNMRRGVAGRGCKAGANRLAPGIFRVPLKAGFLLRVSCAAGRRPPGHLGTTAHRGRIGIASPAHGPPRGPCGLTFDPGVRRVNSGKSSTYGSIVDRRIIGGKGRSGARQALPAPLPAAAPAVKPVTPAAPRVLHLTVDESSAGQRLDNYLMRCLKGVPKTHVYRVIRSGEVRVNKGRAAADTRVQAGDDVRVPPVRVAERPAAAPVPAREFSVLFEDESLLAIDKPAGVAVHGGSGVSFGVIEQLRRARPQAKFLELVHRLDRETSGVLLLAKKRSALTALQDQFRARDTGKTYCRAGAGRLARVAESHRCAAAQVPAARRRAPRAHEYGRRHAGQALDHAGQGGAALCRLHAARREHQDRAHAPDPGAPGAFGPPDRRRRQVRRLRVQQVAGPRHGPTGPALRRHVPACTPAGLRAPGQRRAAGTRSAAAGGLPRRCSMPCRPEFGAHPTLERHLQT